MKKLKFLALGLMLSLVASCGPTSTPTSDPTSTPTSDPTSVPSVEPTVPPTSVEPTNPPTVDPTVDPTNPPTDPTVELLDFSITPNPVYLKIGEIAQVEISISDFEYTVVDPSIVQFASDGRIKGLKAGSTSVLIEKEGYNSQAIDVIVSEHIVELDGKYFSHDYVLSIDDTNVYIDDDVYPILESNYLIKNDLKFEEISIEIEGVKKRISFVNQQYDAAGYQVLFDGTIYQPSIAEFTGSYSYYGSGESSEVYHTFGDYFNKTSNYFDVGIHTTMGAADKYYQAESYYKIYDGERTVVIDLYDFDGYLSFSLKVNKETNALYDIDYLMDMLVIDPGVTLHGYVNAAGAKAVYTSNGKIYVNNNEFDYRVVSEEGKGYHLIYGENRKLEFTPYGIYLTEGNVKQEYLNKYPVLAAGDYYGSSSILTIYNYEANASSILFNNQVYNDAEFVIYEHKIAMRYDFGYFVFEGEGLIRFVDSVNNREEYFLSLEYLSNNVFGYYFTGVIEGESILLNIRFSIDHYVLTKNSIEEEVTMQYIKELSKISFVDQFGGMYLLRDDLGSPTFEYILNGQIIAHYAKDLVFETGDFISSNGETLNFHLTSITMNDVEYKISIFFKPSVNGMATSSLFVHGLDLVLEYFDQNITEYDEEGTMVKNYIPINYTTGIAGTYSFNGPYGVESFVIDDQNKLSADTLINGTLQRVEYDYTFMILRRNGAPTLTLLIEYGDVIVYAYLKNGVLEVMDTKYVTSRLFLAQGLYVSDDNTSIVYIKDGKPYVDGVEFPTVQISYFENNVEFVDGDNGRLLIYTNNGTLGDLDNTIRLEKDSNYVDYKQVQNTLPNLLGDYTDSSLGSITVKEAVNPFTNLASGYALTYSGGTIEDYKVVLHNGEVAMVFSDLFYEFIVYFNAGTPSIVVNSKGSIPPPPPPPII